MRERHQTSSVGTAQRIPEGRYQWIDESRSTGFQASQTQKVSSKVVDKSEFPSGVLTLTNWTMMPDGSTYMFVWASKWRVVTNAQSGIDGLRTTDKYHAVAYSDSGTPLVIIPGCQVKGYAFCTGNPQLKGGSQVYEVR